MDNCVLCLEEKTFDNCIKSASRQWSQLNILNIIEKYFWPIENLRPNGGICYECWQQLYDFHIFHKNIEETHQLNVKFAKQRLQNKSFHHFVEVYKYNEEFNVETENKMSQKHSFPLPFDIGPNNFFDEISIKDELVDEISSNEQNERQSYSITIADNNTVKVENVMKKPKGKRGRPRKIPSISEMVLKQPKGKRGRPKKIVDNNEIIRKQKTGKRGRPRNKIKIDIAKKGKRGRPRKIQLTEHTDNVINISGAKVPANLEQPAVQTPIKLLENLPLSEQNTSKVLVKETKGKGFIYKKHMDKFKKRKRMQQHKALMRNYIATSVRCMSFIKK